jgi:hypothetical protein
MNERRFDDLWFDNGYLWQAMKWENRILCAYRLIPYQGEIPNLYAMVTDTNGITAPLMLRDLKLKARLR